MRGDSLVTPRSAASFAQQCKPVVPARTSASYLPSHKRHLDFPNALEVGGGTSARRRCATAAAVARITLALCPRQQRERQWRAARALGRSGQRHPRSGRVQGSAKARAASGASAAATLRLSWASGASVASAPRFPGRALRRPTYDVKSNKLDDARLFSPSWMAGGGLRPRSASSACVIVDERVTPRRLAAAAARVTDGDTDVPPVLLLGGVVGAAAEGAPGVPRVAGVAWLVPATAGAADAPADVDEADGVGAPSRPRESRRKLLVMADRARAARSMAPAFTAQAPPARPHGASRARGVRWARLRPTCSICAFDLV